MKVHISFFFAVAAGAGLRYPVQVRFRTTVHDSVLDEIIVAAELPTTVMSSEDGKAIEYDIEVPDDIIIDDVQVAAYLQLADGSWSTTVLGGTSDLSTDTVMCFDGYMLST